MPGMRFMATKMEGGGWIYLGGDGKTVHPCCLAHVDVFHPRLVDALFCLYQHEMNGTQLREQAAIVDLNGQRMKMFSKCQFPGCIGDTDTAAVNALMPHGRHFCQDHQTIEHVKATTPFVESNNPLDAYQVVI
jgi:hypothetical protein